MAFTLAYDPYSTEHRDAAKRRDEVREWMVQRENRTEHFEPAAELASLNHGLHRAA
jgi:hypothetical protein